MKKHIADLSRDELDAAVMSKKALPDFIHKRNIFELQCNMNVAHGMLLQSIMKNQGFINQNRAIELRSCIVALFLGIKDMIESNGCVDMGGLQKRPEFWPNEVKTDFVRCLDLCYANKIDYKLRDVQELFYLCTYVNYSLNKIGITDLLIDNKIDETPLEDL